MQLDEAPNPFQFRPAQEREKRLLIPSTIRVAMLTESLNLRSALDKSLRSTQINLQQFYSPDLARQEINMKNCDVAIIDIEREDCWPEVVFDRFDEIASFFPIIIFCRNQREMLSCRQRANHVADVYSYETAHDPRFFSIIEAAKMRMETTEAA